jgi:very-long-chain ceramide synthase
VFIFAWFLTRHVFYLAICWSIHADVPTTMPYGCYDSATGLDASMKHSTWPRDGGQAVLANIFQSFRDPGGVVCFNSRIQHGFLALLLSLQVLILLWFAMMLRVVWKVIRGQNANDVRSDSEESSEEIEVEGSLAAVTPLEEEVSAEELRFGQRKMPRGGLRRTAARFRGGRNAMNTTRDRKEILGRIGCDGPS